MNSTKWYCGLQNFLNAPHRANANTVVLWLSAFLNSKKNI